MVLSSDYHIELVLLRHLLQCFMQCYHPCLVRTVNSKARPMHGKQDSDTGKIPKHAEQWAKNACNTEWMAEKGND